MNLRQMRYFCEVVNTGSARSAAESLFVAPTAISMQLAALEEHLGGLLFDRSSRPMALTPLGRFVYPKAQELLAAAARLEREAQGVAAGNLGWLSIGFTRSTIFSILPDAVRAMQSTHPDARIDLVELLTEDQPASLRSGAIHLAVGRCMGPYIEEPDLSCSLLVHDPLVAVIPIHHPLAVRPSVRAVDLEVLPFISYPGNANSHFSRQVLAVLLAAGAAPKIGHEAKEIHTALGLVAAGLGVTVVGRSVSKNNRTDISFVPISDISAHSTVFTMRLKHDQNQLVEAFMRTLNQQLLAHSASDA